MGSGDRNLLAKGWPSAWSRQPANGYSLKRVEEFQHYGLQQHSWQMPLVSKGHRGQPGQSCNHLRGNPRTRTQGLRLFAARGGVWQTIRSTCSAPGADCRGRRKQPDAQGGWTPPGLAVRAPPQTKTCHQSSVDRDSPFRLLLISYNRVPLPRGPLGLEPSFPVSFARLPSLMGCETEIQQLGYLPDRRPLNHGQPRRSSCSCSPQGCACVSGPLSLKSTGIVIKLIILAPNGVNPKIPIPTSIPHVLPQSSLPPYFTLKSLLKPASLVQPPTAKIRIGLVGS